jgi:hypothetical protein
MVSAVCMNPNAGGNYAAIKPVQRVGETTYPGQKRGPLLNLATAYVNVLPSTPLVGLSPGAQNVTTI